jgi:hypothetical protein
MSNLLARLKVGTAALLRGGTVAELNPPGEATVEAVIDAVGEGRSGIAVSSEAGGGKKKDKAGRMPGDEGYDENDLADDEPEAVAHVTQPVASPAAPAVDPVAAAVSAERARWNGVLASPEAVGRMELAQHMLSTTDLAADAIVSSLKVAPQAQQQQSVTALLGHDNPNLHAGGDAGLDSRAVASAGWDKAIAFANGPSAK